MHACMHAAGHLHCCAGAVSVHRCRILLAVSACCYVQACKAARGMGDVFERVQAWYAVHGACQHVAASGLSQVRAALMCRRRRFMQTRRWRLGCGVRACLTRLSRSGVSCKLLMSGTKHVKE